ncbi:MAG: hypothetical protein JSS34_00320 [Proteobacteria bacterium]|nr:hypothetical protein [Pseudomonadota bacterium]
MKKTIMLKQTLAVCFLILCSSLKSTAFNNEDIAACNKCQALNACQKCRAIYHSYISALSDCHNTKTNNKANAACRKGCETKYTQLFNACIKKSVPPEFQGQCTFVSPE